LNGDFIVVFTNWCRGIVLFRSGTNRFAHFMRPHTVGARVLGSNSEAVVNALDDVHVEYVTVSSFEIRFLTISKSILEIVSAIISEATD